MKRATTRMGSRARSRALGIATRPLPALALAILVAVVGPARASGSSALSSPSGLGMDARIACQTAIEETLWEHRIWPAVNPGAKPGLWDMTSPAAVEAKAREALERTQALAELWDVHVTPAMLQAEIDRQAASTRSPALLRALWTALGDEPQLVAECLARPALVNGMLEERFGRDPRFRGVELGRWWSDHRERFTGRWTTPAGAYSLPEIPDGNACDTWDDTPSIPLVTLGRTVWTGSEMIFIGGDQGHRYSPATDTWETMTTAGHPGSVTDFSAVWTGTELIQWGGCDGGTEFCTTWLGGRYAPASDTWTLTSLTGVPSPRRLHDAVWTGSEMIVWGGCTEDSAGNQNCDIELDTGGRYDPSTDTWSAMTTVGAPAARIEPEMVWTGSQMIVWSGTSAAHPGGRYDPSTDSWLAISTVGAPEGMRSPVVWMGTEMIAWGGCVDWPFCSVSTASGGRYDPASDSWTPVSGSGAPSARLQHTAVWSGSEMIVFGGSDDGFGVLGDGARYAPGSDSWTPVDLAGAPSARRDHQAVWAGDEMIVWGGWNPETSRNGARYSPASDTWAAVSANDPNSFREQHTAVWTGAEMIVWGGSGDNAIDLNTGRLYSLATDSWAATAPSGLDPGLGHSAIWTGTEMIIWGGSVHSGPGEGGRYDPVADAWTPTSTAGAPPASAHHTAVWTGTTMVVWGGSTQSNPFSRSGGRYDVATDTWQPVTLAGAPGGRYGGAAVWTGDVMVVWGGVGTTELIADGGRYDPAADGWSPVSAAGQPSPRIFHTAFWNGSEMVVWGGAADVNPWDLRNDGGKYDPLSDSWVPTSVTGAPAGRAKHSSAWTGSEMIVWGGCNGGGCSDQLVSGGRYDLDTGEWQPTNEAGAPREREFHSAVWTGSEMIVWGGYGGRGKLHTGGRYAAGPSCTNDIFADGFESGDLSAWDVAVP